MWCNAPFLKASITCFYQSIFGAYAIITVNTSKGVHHGFSHYYNNLANSILTWSNHPRYDSSRGELEIWDKDSAYEINKYGEVVKFLTFIFCHAVSLIIFYLLYLMMR